MERIKAAWIAFLHPELVTIRDPLTGALTRKEFNRLAERIIKRAKISGEGLVLLYLDIDGLKKTNDTGGHLAGDKMIKDFVNAIFANTRPSDICARWHGEGGDEFVLLLPNTRWSNGVITTAVRIENIFPNFSWGATILLDNRDDTLDDMVKRAEELMCLSKRAKYKKG